MSPTASAICFLFDDFIGSGVAVGALALGATEVLVEVLNTGSDIDGGSVWEGRMDVMVLKIDQPAIHRFHETIRLRIIHSRYSNRLEVKPGWSTGRYKRDC